MQVVDYTGGAPSSAGKFVHIAGPDDEYLVLSPITETEYHAQIVSRFCRERNDVSCTPTPAGDDASLDLPGWRVLGGGMYKLDRDANTLRLWSSSKAFGPFDSVRIRNALKSTPGWREQILQFGTNH